MRPRLARRGPNESNQGPRRDRLWTDDYRSILLNRSRLVFVVDVCMDAAWNAVGISVIAQASGCGTAVLQPNPALLPGLVPYDLTRDGSPLRFNDTGVVNE